MRIDDVKRTQYDRLATVKRSDATVGGSSNASVDMSASGGESRADRIEKLKQMFAAGRPINVDQLANKLIESGVFFEKKS